MNNEERLIRVKNCEFLYKFFLVLGILVLLDGGLKQLGLALSYVIFYALRTFLPTESIYVWVGIFQMSWILWFTLAALFKRKSKTFQKESNSTMVNISEEKADMKLRIVVGAIVLVLAMLSIFGYNKHTTLTGAEQAVVETFTSKATELQNTNQKVKESTAIIIGLINAAANNGINNDEFNKESSVLLKNATAFQSQIDDLLAFLNDNVTTFKESSTQNSWRVVIEVFNFRSQYNRKLIMLANTGVTLNFNDESSVDKFTGIATELEVMESRLPEMQNKLNDALGGKY